MSNPYKPPRSWKEALRKPCISAYQVEEESGFVCVHLAPGWRTSEGTITLHCCWDESIPLAEYADAPTVAIGDRRRISLPIQRMTRYIGVTQRHMDSAFEALLTEWPDLRKDPAPSGALGPTTPRTISPADLPVPRPEP